ncbi:MAG TPA: hypothetical protein DDX98_15590 [Bacteroidales bacterium]|jgi:hypothetical protein|nr:hypothetical protein [Bacteroidales bacterium]
MKHLILSLTLLSFLSISCNQSKSNKSLLPTIIGGMHDVVVVMSAKNWEAEPGDTLRSFLLQSVPAIAQEEKLFDLIWMPHDGFTPAVKKQRNIILTQIGPDYQERIVYRESLWAKSQLVIQIMAPNPEAFAKLITEYGDEIVNRFQDAELNRVKDNYKNNHDKEIRATLKENHSLDLILPRGYKINVEKENFVWLINSYRNITENILVYHYPYTDNNTFTTDYLVDKRDAFMKTYVIGEVEGSYPSTETRFPITTSEYNFNDSIYTMELRGWWKMNKGMAMGGPFVSISQFDEPRGRIVTVDGFVFGAGEDKRELLKHLEAVLFSLEFPENE